MKCSYCNKRFSLSWTHYFLMNIGKGKCPHCGKDLCFKDKNYSNRIFIDKKKEFIIFGIILLLYLSGVLFAGFFYYPIFDEFKDYLFLFPLIAINIGVIFLDKYVAENYAVLQENTKNLSRKKH